MSRTKNLAFDAALGARVRQARIAARLSQGQLGDALGISFQQVQKYEIGRDRVTVETLLITAAALGVRPLDLLDADTVALARSGISEASDGPLSAEEIPQAA